MKTKIYPYYDKVDNKVLLGIKVYFNGKWMNAAENGKKLLYKTDQEVEAKRKELRKTKV